MAPGRPNAINSPEVALELSASPCAAAVVPSRHDQPPSIPWARGLHQTRASACWESDLAELHIETHPDRLKAFDGCLRERIQALVGHVDVDLDRPLSPDDE